MVLGELEVVTVGDAPLDDRMRALAGAAGEALTNAAKHAGATRVTVLVAFQPDHIQLGIVDDGKGFDPSRTPALYAQMAAAETALRPTAVRDN